MTSVRLLIGPLLRRVAGTRATVWVETSAPALVRVRTPHGAGGEATTFTAFDHHYALVVVDGLAPGAETTYEVLIDDEVAWPLPGDSFPPSVIRTREADDRDQPVRLVFGSCRETTQHSTTRRLPPDALDAYARRLMAGGERRPDLILLLGDQVYADNTSRTVRKLLRRRRRRPAGAPPDEVVTYDEYTKLYLESWRDPEIRWLFSTVPTAMIFDDHEIVDDWNTSGSWRANIREQSWWSERIAAGLASYWVYQHLGNLDPDELASDPVYPNAVAADDATSVLKEFAARVDKESDVAHDTEEWRAGQYQWSYALDVGRTRVVMLDNRCSRVLDARKRAMLPPGEWAWFLDQAHGSYDHLVVGSSLPWLLPPGLHHLESWNERLADSDRRWVSRTSERVRRAVDLEHWAAFRRSFEAMAELFARLGTGGTPAAGSVGASVTAGAGAAGTAADAAGGAAAGGAGASTTGASAAAQRVGAGPAYAPPASINVLSGDVHHSYVAEVRFSGDVVTPVHQLTCSPIHNQVPAVMRPLMRLGWWRGPSEAVRALARTAGLRSPAVRWRRKAGPYFGNAVSTLDNAGRASTVTIEGTDKHGSLKLVANVQLTRT